MLCALQPVAPLFEGWLDGEEFCSPHCNSSQWRITSGRRRHRDVILEVFPPAERVWLLLLLQKHLQGERKGRIRLEKDRS